MDGSLRAWNWKYFQIQGSYRWISGVVIKFHCSVTEGMFKPCEEL
jgi:hypothetical protein